MLAKEPRIPQNITVHLGGKDQAAQNVTVPFIDYIKNVASSEVYPTWDEDALRANIYAQISYALNRVYTEFYRSKGYDFDITSTTAMDQKFINGRNIFENINLLVGEIFDSYITRIGKIEPLAAKYCNGTTVTCEGLSQWGSEELAQKGYDDFSILTYYYGKDIELMTDVPVEKAKQSYPGTPLIAGSTGQSVKLIQLALNRISQNYPLIPKQAQVDGIFGSNTEAAVKTFQKIFDLTQDGVVGKGTWYKILAIYNAIARLSELNSEGSELFKASLEYPDAISEGNSGEKVKILQYFLALIGDFYTTIPSVEITGYFGPETKESVLAFQQQFGLPQTGIVDAETWDAIYNEFKGIADTLFADNKIFPVNTLPFGGEVLKKGSSGQYVMALQEYLNVISLVHTEISPVSPSGDFGEDTELAVKQYQSFAELPQTGIVDKRVWDSIVNTYKDVTSSATPRPEQFPGYTMKLGDQDPV